MDGVFERIADANSDVIAVTKALTGVLSIIEDSKDDSMVAVHIIIEVLQEKMVRSTDIIGESVTTVARALSGR